VAHSYGGAVITGAGTDPSVAGLVYIAAHMPDSGEKESDGGKRFPSDLAKSGAIKKLPDGFTFVDPGQSHELFAADLPAEQAALMARSQVLNFRGQLLSNDHHSRLAQQAKLDADGRKPIELSVQTSSAGGPVMLRVTPSKYRKRVTRFTSHIRKRLPL